MLSPERDWYTIAEISTEYAIPESTLRQWIRKGEFQAYRLPNGALRINRTDAEQLLKPTLKVTAP